MANVEISDNVCSSDGCGVLLAKRTSAENCTAARNRVVESNEQPSSLLYAPASSKITVQGFVASENNLTVFQVRHGVLSLSNASFNRNSLAMDRHQKQNTSCIRLVASSATISKSSFTENEGYEGPAVVAKKSNILLHSSFLLSNAAFWRGGCVSVEKSDVKLENTTATNNSAENNGGVVSAWRKSNVTLANSAATSNSAGSSGGVVDAYDKSSVTLANSAAISNSAGSSGGVVDAYDKSSVTLANSAAISNSAGSSGGVVSAWRKSNVTLANSAATSNSAGFSGGVVDTYHKSSVKLVNSAVANNSAGYSGGVVDAYYMSSVKLVNSAVANNSAGSRGGVVSAFHSNVKLENTFAASNSAELNGGVVYASRWYLKLENTTAVNNSAGSSGGVVYVYDKSSVKLVNSAVANNSAGDGGGVVCAHDKSTVKLEDTIAVNNSARDGGGVVYVFDKSTVKLKNFAAINNNAGSNGGVVCANSSSNVKLANTTATSNNAADGGGCLFTKDSTATLVATNANSNKAETGGFMSAEQSNASLKHTNARGNSADREGGFIYARQSMITLEYLKATNGSSECGALLYGRNSTLRLAHSHLSSSTSKTAGGFVAASHRSSVFISNSAVVQGKSKDGGAIWLEKSHSTARKLTIAHCEADGDGGGVMAKDASTFLCADCVLHDNSANRGNGGAVFFDVDRKQTLALQLTSSRVKDNTAILGGKRLFTKKISLHSLLGGVFFGCEEKNEECLTKAIDCPFMALTGTRFSGNTASFGGGAVFAGYLEAIRIRCSSASADEGLSFYEPREWRTLHSVGSADDVCPSWKNNNAKLYGPDVGTYATSARMTIADATNSVCESGGEDCVIEGYRASEELPAARVELLDRLDQGPATSYQPITANMSSGSRRFLTGSIVLPMEEGSCSFQHIEAFVPPGKYKLTVEFDKREIKRIGVRVRVRDCLVGESWSDGGICVVCGSTTYNFPPLKTACQSCPENGNCESRVITPNDGYWQKTPCSDRLYRCLPTAACRFDNRSDKLTEAVSDVTSCKFDEKWIVGYTGTQCAEGHEGPLCGSCSDEYGSGLSSECKECPCSYSSAIYIAMSTLFLLGMTAMMIRGNLSALRGATRQIPYQTASSSSLLLAEPDSSHPEPEDEADDGVSASEKVLAKWKVVEMFKITLSYTQVTVLLASLDVGWALSLIVMAEAAEFFGGLPSDGIRRSVVCLSSEDMFLQPTALALVINTCVIPCAVLFFWIVFWATKSVKGGNDTPPQFLEKRCVLSLMVIWYITLVPVLKTALSVFLCVDVHDPVDSDEVDVTHKYWAVDTALECYRGDHSTLTYALVAAFVCPVYGGLFLLFVAFLRIPVRHLVHKQGWAFQTSGFLYRSYRMDRRRYWEVAIVVRKAGIAFLVFCAHLFDSALSITGIAHLITLAIAAQILASPYRQRFEDLNRLEIGSLFVSLVTTLAASMLNEEAYPENYARELLTVACVLLNLITFFFFMFHILKFAAEFFKSDLEEKGQTCAPNANMFRVLAQWICYEIKHHFTKSRTTPVEFESSTRSAIEG